MTSHRMTDEVWDESDQTAESVDVPADVLEILRDADHEPEIRQANGHTNNRNRRPEIVLTNDLRSDSREAWRVIHLANKPPRLFRHGTAPARIESDDEGRPVVRIVTVDRMRHFLARAAGWYRRKADKTGAKRDTSTKPPHDVVRDVLATPDMKLPVLTRIVAAPVFAPNGVLQTEPGYHAASKTYYAAMDGFSMPTVPTVPTTRDIAEARRLIVDDILFDFPLTGAAERANAVALMLLPFARELIDGATPLHLIEKPCPGTGATLLVDVVTFPATGAPVATMTEGADEDEWRKRITAKLAGGPTIVLVDNLRRRLESSAVSSAITSPCWEDRILGLSQIVSLPVRCVWVATGNNPSVSSEIARRTIRIRMDARIDRPWMRNGFRHSDLRGWAKANRGRLVWAALTLIRAWIVAGRPSGANPVLGMFESWSTTMGGILAVAGVPGFLANLDDFYEASDAEGEAWRSLIVAWWERFGDREVGGKELWDLGKNESTLSITGETEHAQRVRFGKMLSDHRDRAYSVTRPDGTAATLRIIRAGARRRAQLWRLEPMTVQTTGECGECPAGDQNDGPPSGECVSTHVAGESEKPVGECGEFGECFVPRVENDSFQKLLGEKNTHKYSHTHTSRHVDVAELDERAAIQEFGGG